MSAVGRHGDLEISQDVRLQEAVWAWQRVMWGLFLATIVLAILGLFGGGPLGRASASDPAGRVVVDYDRFGRRGSDSHLDVAFLPGPGGESRIWLDGDYIRQAGVERVSPAPQREVADAAGTTFVLATSPGDRPVRVRFWQNTERAGVLRAKVRVDDGPLIGVVQIVYP